MPDSKKIETHQMLFEYHLNAWDGAKDKGSHEAAERALDAAAKHAAILNALRGTEND